MKFRRRSEGRTMLLRRPFGEISLFVSHCGSSFIFLVALLSESGIHSPLSALPVMSDRWWAGCDPRTLWERRRRSGDPFPFLASVVPSFRNEPKGSIQVHSTPGARKWGRREAPLMWPRARYAHCGQGRPPDRVMIFVSCSPATAS